MDTNQLVNQISDSITASGKKFKDISKESIFSLLDRSGIPKKTWESIYDQLEKLYVPNQGTTLNSKNSAT